MRYLICRLFVLLPLMAPAKAPASSPLHFGITIKRSLLTEPINGRLFVILGRTNNPEPRLTLGKTGPDAPLVLARDIRGWAAGAAVVLDERSFGFTNLAALTPHAPLTPK